MQIKEAVMDFDGKVCARSWVKKLKNLGRIYGLDMECMRMMKSNAQRWLYAQHFGNPEDMRQAFANICFPRKGDKVTIAVGTATRGVTTPKTVASPRESLDLVSLFKFFFVQNLNFPLIGECLIDSGIAFRSLNNVWSQLK
ncbi:uncharacterized protein LOC121467781 [Drosophila elegans]|uniref:uncharacterized protein LOC121467781 n=1 Tax=Drosophila elegans TaxID=30023 RepID=UPI001BC84B37|nr:uncharacterized protein LOC121467781 [Drosophila elegans]